MQKSTKAVIGIVAAAAAVWGGAQVRQTMACSGLEEDYLNAVSSIKSFIQTKSLMAQLDKPTTNYDDLIKIKTDDLAKTLGQIHETCGARAAATATRKGSEMLL